MMKSCPRCKSTRVTHGPVGMKCRKCNFENRRDKPLDSFKSFGKMDPDGIENLIADVEDDI